MIDRGGRLLLASLAQFQAVEIDRSGRFQKVYDLTKLLGMKETERSKNDIAAFSIDRSGNMLVTIPTMFKVFVISPGGDTRAFGRPGSSPGSFGNVAGVVADDQGDVIVADKGRGVVMIFDDKLEFVTEFGSGDDGRFGLTRPTDLVLGASGKLYVTQARERGVAVFKVDPGGEEKEPGRGRQAGRDSPALQRPAAPPQRAEKISQGGCPDDGVGVQFGGSGGPGRGEQESGRRWLSAQSLQLRTKEVP
jgi:hypothetical protein